MAVTAAAFFHLWRSHADTEQALLERRFTVYQHALQDRLRSQELLLHALQGLLSGPSRVTRDDFAASVEQMRPFFPSLQSAGWIRRVAVGDIPAVEQEARAEGVAGFTVRNPDGPPSGRTETEEDLLVVLYLEPRRGSEAVLGINIVSLPGRRPALEQACATGRIAATEQIRLVHDRAESVGLGLFMPVYRKGAVAADPEARCAALVGYVGAGFRIEGLIREAFDGLPPLTADLYVLDEEAPPGRRLLASYPAEGRRTGGSIPLDEARIAEGALSRRVEVAGRNWRITMVAEPGLFGVAPGADAWAALGAGLALTALLAAHLRREQRARDLLQAEAVARTSLARALRDSEERFRLALRHSHVMLFSQDRGLRYVWVYNPPAGLRADAIIGRIDAEIFPPEVAGPLEAIKRPVMATGIGTRREIRIPLGDGPIIQDLVVEPLHDETGAVTGIICAAIDITESALIKEALAEAHIEAERANQAKTRFLAAASHDLRQPFQAMSLFHHILMSRLTDPRQVDVANKLGEALAAGNALLNALLDTSALEAGNVKPRVTIFRFQEVAGRLATEMADQAAAKGLDFRMVPCSAVVRSDPVLLERMVRNLLVNALRYTSAGAILLGCRHGGDRIRVEVWDTGPGIAADQLARIFEDFYRGNGEQQDSSRGLGLGLSIVRRMAQILDHPVTVRSRPGHGTVFSITVPLAGSSPDGMGKGDAANDDAANAPAELARTPTFAGQS